MNDSIKNPEPADEIRFGETDDEGYGRVTLDGQRLTADPDGYAALAEEDEGVGATKAGVGGYLETAGHEPTSPTDARSDVT